VPQSPRRVQAGRGWFILMDNLINDALDFAASGTLWAGDQAVLGDEVAAAQAVGVSNRDNAPYRFVLSH
jgi:3-methyladenine DNA glycosylase Mpg